MRQLSLASTTESSDFRADSERLLHGHTDIQIVRLVSSSSSLILYLTIILFSSISTIFHGSTRNSKNQDERGRGKGLTRDSVMRVKSLPSRVKPYAESLDAGR